MSRARNIKPGFFKNEVLVELPFEYRLLFIGLWTMADRAGRLEDRPTKVRMELFPADAVDVDAGLQSLHDNGFILRYVIEGKRLIQVLAWGKHQNPHIKEAQSTLPAPDEHGVSTVQAPTKASASPSDSLIPDSGYLIPLEPAGSVAAARSCPNGTRLAADWSLPDDWKKWAASERPDVDATREGQCFADYWHGVAGAKGRKADWEATWRNWIRRAQARGGGGGRNGSPPREPQHLPDLKS